MAELTAEQRGALAVADRLARLGVPHFLARPDPTSRTGYALPSGWERAPADPATVAAWTPGWALCMVTGCGLDVVDLDPRQGGELPTVAAPRTHAVASTPSGGRHLLMASLGLESRDGIWPGVDYKGGTADGRGRGFAFVAPTVRRSKVDGALRVYRWERFDPEGIGRPLAYDGGGAEVRARVLELRQARSTEGAPRRVPRSAAAREWEAATARLAADVRRWAADGWGGAAHAGLLAASTHLARLSPEHAEAAYLAAFRAAGQEPDVADLAKLHSALDAAVPDEIVPDEGCSPAELFMAGVPTTANRPKVTADVPEDPMGRDGAGPFRFLDEAEAALIVTPDPLVDGLLYRGTKARLFGESTRGKTWLAMDIAACVRNGAPWLERFEVRAGEVLFVAAEGAPSFAPRMRTWGLAHGCKSRLKFWPEPVQIGGPHWDAFVQACEREGFVLVVQDTQAAMTVGRKEDSNDDAGEVQGAWTQLVHSAGKPTSLSVHHVGWAEQGRPRGASAMFAGMDTELRLAERERGLVLVTEKQRYAVKLGPVAFRLVPEHGGLVVRPAATGVEGLLTDPTKMAEARAMVAALELHVATGGTAPGASPTAVRRKLRDMGYRGDDRSKGAQSSALWWAAQLYLQGLGVGGFAPPGDVNET